MTNLVNKPGKLRALALRGSFYELVGIAAGQGLRFLSNLLLTRLLFPEAFGMSAMVAIFNQGLTMLSDVGVAPGVVQSPRGDDPDFLNTAWTIQVTRGVGLFLVGVACAWPMAWLYGSPDLGPLLAVGSASVLITGLASTSLISLKRKVDSRRLMLVEVGGQIVGLAVMVPLAWQTRSVWALVVGGLVTAAARSAASHLFVDVGYKNRLFWSPDAAKAIARFGRWIFFASAIQFFAQQLDRLFMGKFLGLKQLGIYAVATALAGLGTMMTSRLTHQVLFPVLSQVYREQPHRLRDAYYRARLAMDLLILPTTGAAFVLAPLLIDVLYDDRYADAGWMLRVLTLRVALVCIVTPCETCLYAMGFSKSGFVKSAMRMGWMVIGLPAGYYLFGLKGVVYAAALSELPGVVALLREFAQRDVLSIRRELLVPVLFVAGMLLASPFASL